MTWCLVKKSTGTTLPLHVTNEKLHRNTSIARCNELSTVGANECWNTYLKTRYAPMADLHCSSMHVMDKTKESSTISIME